jgi:hypothetical protein
MLDDHAVYQCVRRHMLAQLAASADDAGSRRLRGYRGCKCAIGCLIREEHYHPALEHLAVAYCRNYPDSPLLMALAASGVDVRSKASIDLLIALENIHDGTAVDEWPHRLDRLGRERGFIADTSPSELATA